MCWCCCSRAFSFFLICYQHLIIPPNQIAEIALPCHWHTPKQYYKFNAETLIKDIGTVLVIHFDFLVQNVAVQLVAEHCDVPGSRYEKVFLANECQQLPISASNPDLLKSGLKDFVIKHGNKLSNECIYCFPSW